MQAQCLQVYFSMRCNSNNTGRSDGVSFVLQCFGRLVFRFSSFFIYGMMDLIQNGSGVQA